MNKIMWIALKAKALFSVFAVYISLAGAVGFSCFILEESFQTSMFSTWQAKDAGDWRLVKKGAILMDGINTHLKIVNYGAGWINPLSFLSYFDYSRSADYYVEALNANIFANDPACFNGEIVTFRFTPESIEPDGGKIMLRNRNITVEATEWPGMGALVVTGRATATGGNVTITEVKIQKGE